MAWPAVGEAGASAQGFVRTLGAIDRWGWAIFLVILDASVVPQVFWKKHT
jgi:hypothetical protein